MQMPLMYHGGGWDRHDILTTGIGTYRDKDKDREGGRGGKEGR